MSPSCPGCRADGTDAIKYGRYFRRTDSRYIARFKCRHCARHYSRATGTPCYRQRRRRVNEPIRKLLSSGVSMRRIALLLGISRDTVARRLVHLAEQARNRHQQRLAQLAPVTQVQFDDLITFEHTRLKPVSVSTVIDSQRWYILGVAVAQMPANGPQAAHSRARYGRRRDQSPQARRQLFHRLSGYISPEACFSSDEHRHYGPLVRHYFPQAQHQRHKSIRGCISGQGELKKAAFDPLFAINHVLAMFRANINRLVRRTWCTTKTLDSLENHLMIFLDYYADKLRPKRARKQEGEAAGRPTATG